MTEVETSIVIRAFNEEQHLPGLLHAIQQQTYRDFEVIVVDSGSYDGTPDIALRHGASLIRIESRDFTFGYSLNTGIRHSRGRFIAIVSAHVLPLDAQWLSYLIEPLRDPSVAMVYGRQLGTDTSKFSEAQDFCRTFGDESRTVTPPDFFANNANSSIRKDLWEQHPFDEVLPGLEDIAWAKHWLNRSHQVLYEPRSAIYHIHNETWRQVQRRYHREGLAAKWIGIKRRIHIPGEVLREGKYLASDFVLAARQGRLVSKASEIARFRFHKALGTVGGIWDGAVIRDPRKREAIFFDRRYKAVVIRAPKRAALEELELPDVKPGDVLIKVAYADVCDTDLQILDGGLESGAVAYPLTPGREFSGVIARVGPNVAWLDEGMKVVVESLQPCHACPSCRAGKWMACSARKEVGVPGRNGAYGEYVVVPGEFVHVIPRHLELKKAVLCGSVAMVLKGLRRLQSVSTTRGLTACAIMGGGPTAHLCSQILGLRGCEVTVYEREPARLESLHKSRIPVLDNLQELRKFQVIIETGENLDPEGFSLQASPSGAVLLFLGSRHSARRIELQGLAGQTIIVSADSDATAWQEAIDLLPSLDLSAFLQKVVPLEQYKTAWELWRTRRFPKILIEVDPRLQL